MVPAVNGHQASADITSTEIFTDALNSVEAHFLNNRKVGRRAEYDVLVVILRDLNIIFIKSHTHLRRR